MLEQIKKSIEEKYTDMDEIDHILQRPATYIGSIYPELLKYKLFVPSENKIRELENISYIEGLLKIFDEVYTNSIDERRRESRLFDITKINVEVNTDGTIIIEDNGGIPVVIHKKLNVYLPKMLFGMLRTSSNYTEERDGSGLNGIGAKIANIYSSYFRLTTSDGKNKFDIQWSNNMRTIDFENVTPVTNNEHYSRFEFKLELFRFDDKKELDNSSIRIMQKRVIDSCAANPGLEVEFKSNAVDGKLNSTWKFEKFQEYVLLHILKSNKNIQMLEWKNYKNDLVLLMPYTEGLSDIGFVNGNPCNMGTHFSKIYGQVVEYSLPLLQSSGMTLLSDKDIITKMVCFCNFSIKNPDYTSQTKIKLSSKIPPDALKFDKKFLQEFHESEIIEIVKDYYQIKYAAEEKKKLRKLNSVIKSTKTKKLINCNSTNNNIAELWIFEGDSAKAGFDSYRNTSTQAAYILRGKVKNTLELNKEQIVDNVELREIIAALGIEFNSPKSNITNCKYSKIIFATDMDFDGDHIAGLLLTFFAKNFPELFIAQKIYRALSPLIVATNRKTKEEILFWSMEDWNKNGELYNNSNWKIKYCKGLGGLLTHHYDEMLNNQKLIRFKLTSNYMDSINVWFSKNTDIRKTLLIEDDIVEEDLVS